MYESVVAQELHAHGFPMFYYDNKKQGEVDFLIDDYGTLSVLPLEVKSGKDYTVHSALSKFIANEDYSVKQAFVLSNNQHIKTNKGVTYLPVYFTMFIQRATTTTEVTLSIPKIPIQTRLM